MAEIASTTFSQTDGSNTGPLPGLTGATNPNQIDNSIQAMMGAIKREHDWRNLFLTSGGSANAYTLTYSVAPASYYTGQTFTFTANFGCTGSATLNVNGLGAKTIKKDVSGTMTALSSGDIASGAKVKVSYDGTDFIWINWQGAVVSVSAATDSAAGIVELATTTETLTGTDTGRAVTPDGLASLWEQGGDIASSGTITVGEGGYFNVTGTTTITDIDPGTDKAGRCFKLKFSGILTLTHNASTLILPTGANITTAAGDVAEFVSEGSDAVRCVNYHRADGTGLVASGGMTALGSIATTSGTSQSLSSLVLTNYKMVLLVFKGVSTNSASGQIYIGNSTSDDVAASPVLSNVSGWFDAIYHFDIVNGVFSMVGDSTNVGVCYGGTHPLTTSTTSISVATIAGSFDAGTVYFWGVK